MAGLLSLWLAFASSHLRAQEQIAEDAWKRGYNGFAGLCEAFGLKPTQFQQWRETPAEQTLLVVFGAFERLPVDVEDYLLNGGAVLLATDRGERGAVHLRGLDLTAGPLEAVQPEAALQGFQDCPIVTQFDDEHPVTANLLSVATNRPGMILRGALGRERWRVLAEFPPLQQRTEWGLIAWDENIACIVARETITGGRAVVAADQSIFANQMLLYEDNAQLTINLLRWLGEGRTSALIVEGPLFVTPPTPDEVQVELPPPTQEEVLAALRNLPPETLLDFANAVAASAEESGIPNEMLKFLVDKIPARDYQRLLIVAASLILGAIAVRSLVARTAPEQTVGEQETRRRRSVSRQEAFRERQYAARELLERFRADVAASSAVPWPVFLGRIRATGRWWETRRLRRMLRKASGRLGPDARRYWTARRLQRLHQQIGGWRRLLASGALEYRAAEPTGPRTS